MALSIKVNQTENSRLESTDFKNIVFGHVYSDHMFISDYNGKEWQDHRIEPYGPLSLVPGTAALHYAQSIFEGMKAYRADDGRVLLFRPEKNFERLNLSAKRLQMPEIPEELFFFALDHLIGLDEAWVSDEKGMSLYVRPFVFASDEYIGIRPSANYKFVLFTCPVGSYYNRPLKVRIETEYTRAAPGGTGYVKAAGNYAGSLMAMKKAQDDGYDQLIWTDACEHKYLEESGTMNLMFVIDGKIVTPKIKDTILSGIIRESVITLAKDYGYEVEEKMISIDQIISAIKEGKAQEAFGLGTAAVVAPIQTVAYQGEDYNLPDAANYEFANKVYQKLDDIRHGRSEDYLEWIYQIPGDNENFR